MGVDKRPASVSQASKPLASTKKRPKIDNVASATPISVLSPDVSSPEKPAWPLTPADVPDAAKKIYCVIRGRQPGYYYEWQGNGEAQDQVNGFRDALFKSFCKGKGKTAIRPQDLEDVVREAVQYMNHDSASCSYNCGDKCRRPARKFAIQPVPPSEHITKPIEAKNRGLVSCRACNSRPSISLGRICEQCLRSDEVRSKLDSCIQRFQLSAEQAFVLENVAKGRNVFFTGAAGTGKSRVLEAIVAFLRSTHLYGEVVAPTGMAALGVHGSTIHQYAGWDIRVGKLSLEELEPLAGRKKVWKRFSETDVLIIDEISMVECDTLMRLSHMMQHALQTSEKLPFGGVQVVITGDFFQLPCVKPFETCIHCGEFLERKRGLYTCHIHGDYHEQDKWAFRSACWEALSFQSIELKEVHRQNDTTFTSILHSLRRGQGWSAEQQDLILKHPNEVNFDDALKLMPHREDVNNINEAHMEKLSTPPRTYECVDNIHWVREHAEFVDSSRPDNMLAEPFTSLENHRYEQKLVLKEGMQVILLANLDLDAGLVNGSTGKIVGFTDIESDTRPTKYRRYVEERCAEFVNDATESNTGKELWPVVQFKKDAVRVIYPHCSYTELGKEEPFSLLSRTQIPLVMGWALTIHKSQGMTLDHVVANLDKCFSPGQAYVALSRARNLDTLRVQTLPKPSVLIPDAQVVQFMAKTFGGEWNDC